jgi:hypothetical protein
MNPRGSGTELYRNLINVGCPAGLVGRPFAALHQRGKADVARRRRSSGGISVAKPAEEFL